MTPEEILRRLMKHFYASSYGGLEWQYIEGTTLRELDEELEQALLPYLDEKTRAALQPNDGGGANV